MRKCHVCGRRLSGCFGFVKAGDVIECEKGERTLSEVRELCGLCALPALFMDEEELICFFKKIGWLETSLN